MVNVNDIKATLTALIDSLWTDLAGVVNLDALNYEALEAEYNAIAPSVNAGNFEDPSFEVFKAAVLAQVNGAGSAFENTHLVAESMGEGAEITSKPTRTSVAEANKVIMNKVRSLQDTNKYKAAKRVSLDAAVIGYLNASPEGIDIARKKVDANKYDFIAKYSAPSAPKGYMIAVPADAYAATKMEHDEDIAPSAYAEGQNKELIILNKGGFDEFICMNALGCVREAKELFVPNYVTRVTGNEEVDGKRVMIRENVLVNTIEDDVKYAQNKESLPSGPNSLYYTIVYKKDKSSATKTPIGSVKHTMRNSLPAPMNYISAKKYETIEIRRAYSADEAEALTKDYFNRFNKKSHELLDKNVTVVDGAIVASKFFTTNANESYWAENPTVDHWFSKDASGAKAKVGLEGNRLIKHTCEISQTADKKGKVKEVVKNSVRAQKIGLEEVADGSVFVLDMNAPEMQNIASAAANNGVAITNEAVVNFFKAEKILKEKATGNSGEGKTAKPIGAGVWSMYLPAGESADKAAKDLKAELIKALKATK